MANQNRDLSGIHVFGIVLCGFLLGAIVAGPVMARLELIPNGDKLSHMSFESFASIMLGVAAIVVGIVLPLAGIFAFGFLRSDLKHQAEEYISNDILKGHINRKLEEAINSINERMTEEIRSTFNDQQGVVRQYIDFAVSEAKQSEIAGMQVNAENAAVASDSVEWGYEADEYGEKPISKGVKK
jgi:hypothetical protein